MSKTALITGSTGGIGSAFCDILASKGYDLILVSRNKSDLQNQALKLSTKGVNVYFFVVDLSLPNEPQRLYNEVINQKLKVDILINNAGFNEVGNFTITNLSNELNMIQVHIKSLTELTKLFLPQMLERKTGYILNLGSTGSYMPCPSDSVYAATKAYVLSFSNALYYELKGSGVNVTCLCPGATHTSFAKKAGIEDTKLFKIMVMEPNIVAKIGYKSMIKGKRTVTAGLYNKFLVFCSRLLPVSIINPIAQYMIKK